MCVLSFPGTAAKLHGFSSFSIWKSELRSALRLCVGLVGNSIGFPRHALDRSLFSSCFLGLGPSMGFSVLVYLSTKKMKGQWPLCVPSGICPLWLLGDSAPESVPPY